MNKKPLIETNLHLQNPKEYRQALIMNVASSTAIETGASVESVENILTGKKKDKRAKGVHGFDHRRGLGYAYRDASSRA
ncbi:MAG: hypothetical protein AB7H03_12540 [Nitrospirales bacterium]